MCGRFTQKYMWRELVELYRLTQQARNLEPRYNVAATSTIDAVRVRDGARELVPMRWGLVPSWWKKPLKDVPAWESRPKVKFLRPTLPVEIQRRLLRRSSRVFVRVRDSPVINFDEAGA
jgi:putative SOS response-associated peptidase YedK